jgi:glycosyltransferase involved in cell wall biosynthesis
MPDAARPTVVFALHALGLGGTEKGIVSYATHLDRHRFDVRFVTLEALGPRAARLAEAGIEVACAGGDEARLVELLRGADIVHVARHGASEPLLPRAARAAGVRVLIETNIFGAVDHSPDETAFGCHLFISMMCLLRYREAVGQGGADGAFEARHRVLYLPIEAERLAALAPDRRQAKLELGLDPDRPVVGRLGRADDLKWRDLLIDMGPALATLVPDVQLLYCGITPRRERLLRRRGLADRAVLVAPVADERELVRLYRACDVVVAAAAIGESQGLVIGEAMALGIPVVTCSTPWADNAQVELVEHGKTGWIAAAPREFAEAVADLVDNDARRARFGAAGHRRAVAMFDPAALTRQLEALYDHQLGRAGPPARQPSRRAVAAFAAAYPARAAASFRPLRARERLRVRLDRERDRLRLGLNVASVRRRLGVRRRS